MARASATTQMLQMALGVNNDRERQSVFLPPQWMREKLRYPLSWLAVIIIATAIRVPPIFASLPYIDYIDEGYVLHQTINLLNHRNLDPQWYGYPSLPAYLTAAALVAYSPFYRLIHGHSFRRDLPHDKDFHTPLGDNYDLIAPPALIAAGRVVALCLSVGTVVITGLVALQLADRRVAMLAMLLVALCPALVNRSSNVIVDAFATFFALLSVYFSGRIRSLLSRSRNAAMRVAALAGLAAGLAFASKYTVGVVFGTVATIILLLPTTRSVRVALFLVALGGCLLGGSLACPAVVTKPVPIVQWIASAGHFYSTIKSSPGYFAQAVDSSELGWPLVIIGCAGIGVMLRSDSSARAFTIGWIAFAAALLALFAFKPFQPFRNLLPLVPGLCIAAAVVPFQAQRSIERIRSYCAARFAIVLLTTAVIGALCFSSLTALHRRMSQRDTRSLTIDWLQKHAAREDRVLALAELGFLPTEWQRIAAYVRVVPLPRALSLLQRDRFDYVVSTEFDNLAPGPAATDRAEWRAATAGLKRQARFGHIATPLQPYFWRTNDELIVVLALQGSPRGQ